MKKTNRCNLGNRLRQSFLTTGLALLTLSACFRPTPRAALNPKVLSIGNIEPGTIDPSLAALDTEYLIVSALFEGLIAETPTDGMGEENGVADQIHISPDQKTYTFHLRDTARWSDGEPVTCDDFEFAYRRILSPETGSDTAQLLYFIKNAEAFHKSALKDFTQVGVACPHPRELVLELSLPTPFFLSLLKSPAYFPLPKLAMSKLHASDHWAKPKFIVSNGPYRLQTWLLDDHMELVRNSHYWDQGRVQIEEIHFFPMPNLVTQLNYFTAGQLDITSGLPAHAKVSAQTLPEWAPRYREDPRLGTRYLVFNLDRPALANPKIREALSLVLDKKSIVEKIAHVPHYASTFVPLQMPNLNPPTIAPADEFSVNRARLLMAEAGYPEGKGFPGLSLSYVQDSLIREVCVEIQQYFRQSLGVVLMLKPRDLAEHYSSLRKRDFDIGVAAYSADYADANNFLELFLPDSPANYGGWQHSEYEQIVRSNKIESNLKIRSQNYRRAEEILFREKPLVPLFEMTNNYLISPRVKNWSVKPLPGLRNFKYLELVPE